MNNISTKFAVAATFAAAIVLTGLTSTAHAENKKPKWDIAQNTEATANAVETEETSAAIMGSGSGAGKANFQDLSITKYVDNSSSDLIKLNDDKKEQPGMFLKLGAIKGEAQDE